MNVAQSFMEILWGVGIYAIIGVAMYIGFIYLSKFGKYLYETSISYYRLWIKR